MSSGNNTRFSLRSPSSSLLGYGGKKLSKSCSLACSDVAIDGGIVLAGFGDVSAKILAAAVASAMALNSATGVMFPGSRKQPPITRTSFARRKV